MARLFLLGKKSSRIINLNYVSLIEIEHNQSDGASIAKEDDYYKIRFDLTKTAGSDTIYHDIRFNSEEDARNYLLIALNPEF